MRKKKEEDIIPPGGVEEIIPAAPLTDSLAAGERLIPPDDRTKVYDELFGLALDRIAELVRKTEDVDKLTRLLKFIEESREGSGTSASPAWQELLNRLENVHTTVLSTKN